MKMPPKLVYGFEELKQQERVNRRAKGVRENTRASGCRLHERHKIT
jgi:hypothetical protein